MGVATGGLGTQSEVKKITAVLPVYRDKYMHEVLCLVIVNVNLTKCVSQKMSKNITFVAIRCVLSNLQMRKPVFGRSCAPDPAGEDPFP